MEFSFDRSRATNQNIKKESAPQAEANQFQDEIDTSTIQNERLRKAIERNRAKQRERETQLKTGREPSAPQTSAHSANPAYAQHAEAQARMSSPPRRPTMFQESAEAKMAAETVQQTKETQRGLFDQEEVKETKIASTPQVEEAEEAPEVEVKPIRRSVARPEDTEFTPVKRTSKKVAAQQISYQTNKRKIKAIDASLASLSFKFIWAFFAFLILRLFFANGGVTDYWSQRSVLNDRMKELRSIKKENMQLVSEIEKMQTDAAFQKKLVRDNLGFIAKDEFLILFPKDSSVQ